MIHDSDSWFDLFIYVVSYDSWFMIYDSWFMIHDLNMIIYDTFIYHKNDPQSVLDKRLWFKEPEGCFWNSKHPA